MNNKRLGTEFEKEFCQLLASRGYWVHFISPAPNGGQPFDVIAVKNGHAHAIDCKTSSTARFPFTRLEQNQVMAFERWIRCGNGEPKIAVKYAGGIYLIDYTQLKGKGCVNCGEDNIFIDL